MISTSAHSFQTSAECVLAAQLPFDRFAARYLWNCSLASLIIALRSSRDFRRFKVARSTGKWPSGIVVMVCSHVGLEGKDLV